MTASHTRNEAIAVAAGSLCFGFLFCYPMLRHIGQITLFLDWARGFEWSWSVWKTITAFHQFPFWNPYKCGGMPSFANPQSHFFTPFLLLHFLFGPIAGLELEVPLHVSISFAGAYVLSRAIGCRPAAAIASGIAFGGSSWLPLHATVGHEVFLPCAYLPWICAFTWLSIETRRHYWASLAGLLLALCFFEGGVYAVLEAAILAAILGAFTIVLGRSARPLVTLATVALFGAGFAAIKLFPSIQMMNVHPRPGYLSEESFYKTLLSIFSRTQNLSGPWNEGGFWEHGAYVGWPSVLLAIAGVTLSWRRSSPWMAVVVVFFVLGMGGTSAHSAYALLHHLPGFSSTYAPFRLLISLVLGFAVLAGLGAEALSRKGGLTKAAVIGLLTIELADVFVVSPVSLAEAFPAQTIATAPASLPFRQYYDPSPLGMLPLNLANLGAVNCYEANFLDVTNTHVLGYNQPNYRGEQYLEATGSVDLVDWTPEALIYTVNAPAPTLLSVNQNFYEGWQLTEGRGAVRSENGLLAIQLPPSKQRLRVVFRSPFFLDGLCVSVLALLGFFVLWRFEHRCAESCRTRA